MKDKIPKELISSKYRKEMWTESQRVIKLLKKVLPVSSVYLMGSFTTKKKRPADVDFIILLKTKEKNRTKKWANDFVIVPDNDYGKEVLEDAIKWMKQKYGAKKSACIEIK